MADKNFIGSLVDQWIRPGMIITFPYDNGLFFMTNRKSYHNIPGNVPLTVKNIKAGWVGLWGSLYGNSNSYYISVPVREIKKLNIIKVREQ